MIVLSLLFAAAAGHTARLPTPEEKAAESAFRACPGGETLANTITMSWTPLTGAIVRHRAIRERQHLDFPESGDRILLHSLTMDRATAERSVVASRRADGVWHVDEAGQDLSRYPVGALPHKAYDLSVEESRHVDALLEDPCLYASPRFIMPKKPSASGAAQRLEIVTSEHQAVLGWFSERTPAEDALVKLIARD
ncbi:MAG TPA: hypothetical protein VH331_05695 [Allosphingosinicella sp.]|jgi:hypothetical protein|nr:hypothetical protein [Allosphingosinicella sp.]